MQNPSLPSYFVAIYGYPPSSGSLTYCICVVETHNGVWLPTFSQLGIRWSHLVAWDWPWWDYFHLRNQQLLPVRALPCLPDPVVNMGLHTPEVHWIKSFLLWALAGNESWTFKQRQRSRIHMQFSANICSAITNPSERKSPIKLLELRPPCFTSWKPPCVDPQSPQEALLLGTKR